MAKKKTIIVKLANKNLTNQEIALVLRNLADAFGKDMFVEQDILSFDFDRKAIESCPQVP